jgi:hypothetical protein
LVGDITGTVEPVFGVKIKLQPVARLQDNRLANPLLLAGIFQYAHALTGIEADLFPKLYRIVVITDCIQDKFH